jgi:hypothetical protein
MGITPGARTVTKSKAVYRQPRPRNAEIPLTDPDQGISRQSLVGSLRNLKGDHVRGKGSAQFCSGVVEKWRARQDETGHSYVIVFPIAT